MEEIKGNGRKILVVDDEPEICDLLKGWLSYLDFKVMTAANGDEGLWKAKSEKPDLIITDALMPGRTGYQLLDELKKQTGAIKDIPVIVISGRQSMVDLQQKADFFVPKPFAPKEMLAVIEKALSRKGTIPETPA